MINVIQLIIFHRSTDKSHCHDFFFHHFSRCSEESCPHRSGHVDVCIMKTWNEKTRIENGIFNERVLRIAMIEHRRGPNFIEVCRVPSLERDSSSKFQLMPVISNVESFRANPSGVTLRKITNDAAHGKELRKDENWWFFTSLMLATPSTSSRWCIVIVSELREMKCENGKRNNLILMMQKLLTCTRGSRGEKVRHFTCQQWRNLKS